MTTDSRKDEVDLILLGIIIATGKNSVMNIDYALQNNSKKSEFRVLINDELVIRETTTIDKTKSEDITL